LARGRERRAFLVANGDPFNFALAHGVANRIKRIGNETEALLDANLFARVHQATG
jgi:hypothetical protein